MKMYEGVDALIHAFLRLQKFRFYITESSACLHHQHQPINDILGYSDYSF
jgi:hypothetical protein